MPKNTPTEIDYTELPKVAVDAVLLSIDEGVLKTLIIKIKTGPYKDTWCLPGGLVLKTESLEDAVKRILFHKTNISGIYLEQLYTFGAPERDKRSRSVSVAYFALVNNIKNLSIQTTEYYADIKWQKVNDLPTMAFDHENIIKTAVQRLQAKIEYSNIAYSLLPHDFTLTQLQKVYEIILQKPLDKRNFRKKIFTLGLLEKSNRKLTGQAYRPAELYHFTDKKLVFI